MLEVGPGQANYVCFKVLVLSLPPRGQWFGPGQVQADP